MRKENTRYLKGGMSCTSCIYSVLLEVFFIISCKNWRRDGFATKR